MLLKNNQGPARARGALSKEELIRLPAIEAPAAVWKGLALADKLVPTVHCTEDSGTVVLSTERDLQRMCVKLADCTNSFRALQTRVLAMSEKDWTDKEQRRAGNVTVVRAAHDRLGIRKMLLRFSDDIFTQVFELPFWRTWMPELSPVFSRLGIHPSMVVRCLLARIPPGAHIGIHHDTGRWTTLTHRIHVPVVTNPDVVFRVGPIPEDMVRVNFREGFAYELNNRAKHEVFNGGKSHRVHLIFDWTEASAGKAFRPEMQEKLEDQHVEVDEGAPAAGRLPRCPTLTAVKAGENLVQTRRTIRVDGSMPTIGESAGKGAQSKRQVSRAGDDELGKAAAHLWHLLVEGIQVSRNTAICIFRCLQSFSNGETSCWNLCVKMYGLLQCDKDRYQSVLKAAVRACPDEERRDSLVAYLQEVGNTMQWARKIGASSANGPRSILRPIPGFIIIGCMKSGTTSLFDYIMQHPLAVRGRQKEPHLFDWRWNLVQTAQLSSADQSSADNALRTHGYETPSHIHRTCIQFFNMEALEADCATMCGDGSPSYIMGGSQVARRIKEHAPGAKILLILREPVSRAISQYNMIADRNGTPGQLRKRGNLRGRSFEEVVAEDFELLRSTGALKEDSTIDNKAFDEKYLQNLPEGHGCFGFVARGLYAPLLRIWSSYFELGSNLMVLTLEQLKTEGPQPVMNRVFKYLNMPPHTLETTTASNSRSYKAASVAGESIRTQLAEFYAPHNRDLDEILRAVPVSDVAAPPGY